MIGTLTAVDETFAGGVTRDDHTTADTVLRLVDAGDFYEGGGQVDVDGTVYTYTAADLETDELTLTDPLAAALAADAEVRVFPHVVTRTAMVSVDGDPHPVPATVPPELQWLLVLGIREPGTEQQVSVEVLDGRAAVTGVHGEAMTAQVGYSDEPHVYIAGGEGGGVWWMIPDPNGGPYPVPGSKLGSDLTVFNTGGEATASVTGEDGSIAGAIGLFDTLTVGGQDVLAAIQGRSRLIVNDEATTTQGPYTGETGYREVGFQATGGHAYRFECRVAITNEDVTAGTFFSYLRMQTSGAGEADAPTITSPSVDSDDGQITPAAAGYFRMSYLYVAPGDRSVRLLVSGRGGGGRAFSFAFSDLLVTDIGVYDPLVTTGRYSLGGADGQPPPDPTPPPQVRRSTFDFDWAEVYNQFGRADHNIGTLGNKLRQGRTGAAVTYPFGTALRIPNTMRTHLMGATGIKVWLQLTNIGHQGGNVVIGQHTNSSGSSPSTMPTPVDVTQIWLPKGATDQLLLPSAWASRWAAGTNYGITLGRTDGTSDRMLDFHNITAGLSVRARIVAEWTK